MKGRVYLVGAGPGAADLITLRGVECLRRADVVIHDRLVNRGLMVHINPLAEVLYAGKAGGKKSHSQMEINSLILEHALAGKTVVRLKGGDPFVFGRGWEELYACRAIGIECEVVPGVSSSVAAPSAAGIPVTHRGLSRNFTVVTATQADEGELDFKVLSQLDTLVILMGRGKLAHLATSLVAAGKNPRTPVAVVECGTTLEQRVIKGNLLTIAELADHANLGTPATIVVGEVAALATPSAVSTLQQRDRRHESKIFPVRAVADYGL
jgi:uroporphyrin-III C-methyltransferase